MSKASNHSETNILDLATALIERPSLTPADEGCQRIIVERLLPLGFEAEWVYCNDVSNVLLTRGRGAPSFWFLGHTDVVPTGPKEDWQSPPFRPEVRGGCLYGRGAADMKGGVAAMTVALERFVQAHPDHPGQLGLLLTSDEEGPAINGVARVADLVAARHEQPDFCVVGEPSSRERLGDNVRIGRRGSINVDLEIEGVQGHTAFPQHLDNPVHRLAPFLADLVSIAWDAGDADFPPSHCQVSNLNAGTGATNVTPGRVRLSFNFRNGPASPSDRIEKQVRALLKRHHISRYRLDWRVHGEPFLSPAGPLRSAVRSALKSVLGVTPDADTGGGTSDARFMAPLGTEVVELGPVNASIHRVDEHVSVDDLARLGDVYLSVLERIFHR